MKKLIPIFAYTWAFFCVLLIPITFVGNYQFASLLAKMPFMKVNPVFTGGEIDRTIEKDSLKIIINKPVFEALIGKSSKGFVQIKFSGNNQLPNIIKQEIDFNNDGSSDFILNINTISNITKLEPLSKNIKGLIISSKVKKDWIVRVRIANEQS